MKHNIFDQSVRQKGMVRVRGGFSDLNGIVKYNTTIQMKELDNATRIQLENELYRLLEYFFNNTQQFIYPQNLKRPSYYSAVFCKSVLNDVFCESNMNYDYSWQYLFDERMKAVIENAEYNEVLDLIQYTLNWLENRNEIGKGAFYKCYNLLLEKEYVGYRFIDGKLTPISDKLEIETLEQAMNIPFTGCRKQLEKAVGFLSDRVNKDYKNCIKESISAVESLCQVITNDKKATLSDALKKIERNGTVIHPALNQAFQKLYAYTSDQGGIRHAEGMFESNVTFEEAKFMLVSCSAFINYLIAEYGKGSK